MHIYAYLFIFLSVCPSISISHSHFFVLFVSQSQSQHLCCVLASVLYSLPVLVSPVCFPKIFNCIIFKAKVVRLGQTAWEPTSKSPFFFVALNVKEKSFDRKNYKALENKVNHCGRMPEVDKWKDGNVSITSAICFLCCEFFFRPHCSSPPSSTLFSLSHPSPQPVPQSPLYFSLIHFPFLFFYIWSFFSSHLLCSLSKILFVRCQRSGRARLWAERTCHNREHKTEEIDLTFISAVQWRLRKLLEDCRAVYDAQ